MGRFLEGEAPESGALTGGTDREVDASEALHELAGGFRLTGNRVDRRGVFRRGLEQSAGALEARVDVARSHQSVMADLLESSGQDVQKKAADELLGGEGHGLAMTRGEGNGLLRHVEDPVVRERDPLLTSRQADEFPQT